jgi:hypothetical protein
MSAAKLRTSQTILSIKPNSILNAFLDDVYSLNGEMRLGMEIFGGIRRKNR